MPFQEGTRLPGERASKLGHLDVLQSELVNKLIAQFEYPEPQTGDPSNTLWQQASPDATVKPLSLVFAVDGSLQVIKSDNRPVRELAFIKTALLRLDPIAISKLDPDFPHPLALKKIMQDSALYHSTVFPLKNVRVPGQEYLSAMRQIVYESLRDPRLDKRPFETLKWIAYQKWDSTAKRSSPDFQCPCCEQMTPGLPFDADVGECASISCKADLYLSDMLGFHMELLEESASMGFASSYMLIHELLMLFTGVRHFWEHNKRMLSETLFIKDGPLSLRSQYTKVVPLLRSFFKYAHDQGIDVHVIGQEKSGTFFDHLHGIERFADPKKKDESGACAILSHEYIRKEVQRTPGLANQYGLKTNYGGKVFVKPTFMHSMVINIPVVEYQETDGFPSTRSDFIGFERIMATLPNLLSHRFEGALLPVELANGVSSLSSYPSAAILKVFAGI